MIGAELVSDPARYSVAPHPSRAGDGDVVFDGDRPVHTEPLPYTEAVILAERLNLHWERLRHWERETLHPRRGRGGSDS